MVTGMLPRYWQLRNPLDIQFDSDFISGVAIASILIGNTKRDVIGVFIGSQGRRLKGTYETIGFIQF
jgi:hypothetical protein